MNKVILMGRLTRAPEVRYSQGREPVAVGGIRWRSTDVSRERTSRRRTSSLALPSARAANLRRNISGRGSWLL